MYICICICICIYICVCLPMYIHIFLYTYCTHNCIVSIVITCYHHISFFSDPQSLPQGTVPARCFSKTLPAVCPWPCPSKACTPCVSWLRSQLPMLRMSQIPIGWLRLLEEYPPLINKLWFINHY